MQEYATLLPAVYPSTSSFCLNTEHLLQAGNSHLKRLYFVLMKQERHISITLCDASNDFRQDLLLSIVRPFAALSSPEAALLLVSSTKRSAATGARMYFRTRNCVCTAHAHQGVVQSLNSTFFPPHIGAEPGRAEKESRITCMRMLRTNQSKIIRVLTTLLASMCRAMPFSARALKENIFFDVDIVIKNIKT